MAIVVGTDTYVSVSDANTYFKLAIHSSSWDSASNSTREKALATATRSLDRQLWLGSKYEEAPTQMLEFPRSGLTDKNGDPVDETTVPQEVIDATCEYGLALIEDDSIQNQANTGSNIKRLKAGSAEIEYIRGTNGKRFSTIISELIGLWLSASSQYSGPFVSGADNESGFSDTFELYRGY